MPATATVSTLSRAPSPPKDPRPLSAEFGTVDDDGVLHPSAEIPLYAGSSFGWRLELGCEHTVEIDEELKLPAPGDWGTDPDVMISRDRRVASVHSEAPCLDGWVDKTWTVSASDPAGVWIMHVTAAGFATQTFRASFVPAQAPPPSPVSAGVTPSPPWPAPTP